MFRLDPAHFSLMQGRDNPLYERWRDIAGNPYSRSFITGFHYETGHPRSPIVQIRVEPTAPTLTGRIEARGLKPNFAYQIKLRGRFENRRQFETIGKTGRWRLPGLETNYTDDDYRNYPRKDLVQAYIIFDFFITDADGRAARDFALDSSLHVLWKYSQLKIPRQQDLVPVIIHARNPRTYHQPVSESRFEMIWAEREHVRYRHADQVIHLPPGRYEADIILTEESFHDPNPGGGFWATVMSCPVTFTITPDTRESGHYPKASPELRSETPSPSPPTPGT